MSVTPDRLRPPLPPDPNQVDIRAILQPWYFPVSTYADRAQKVDDETCIATYTIPDFQCGPSSREMLQGKRSMSTLDFTNELLVTNKNTIGHFRKDGELQLELFPGYQGIGAIIEAVQQNRPGWLTGFDLIDFSAPVVPGNTVTAKADVLESDGNYLLVNGEVTRFDGKRHTSATNMRFEPMDLPPEIQNVMFAQHQLAEVIAQMAGGSGILLKKLSLDDLVPIYIGIGTSTLAKVPLVAQDILQGRTKLTEVDEMTQKGKKLTVLTFDVSLTRERNGKTAEAGEFSEVLLGFAEKSAVLESIAA